jgi:hypothetical protein
MAAPVRGSAKDGGRGRRKRGPAPTNPPTPVQLGGDIDYHRAFNHLCHVLSLSRTGKPKPALDGMVLTACVLAGGKVDGAAGVDEALQVFFGLPVPAADLSASIERLCAAGKLLPARAGGALTVAPADQAEVQERIDAGNALEQEVRDEWIAGLTKGGLDVGNGDDLWRCLRRYMARVFQQHGALSVELLAPDAGAAPAEVDSLEAALEAALAEQPCADDRLARVAIKAFFEAPTRARTRYLAQLLDNTFTFFAVSFHEAAAQYMRATLPPLTLFFDTNFVFGLLELHDNSLGDAARDLLAFISENDFRFKLYVHQETLSEIERTISGIGRRLLGRRWPQEISRAAVSERRILGALSGVEYRYHKLNAQQPVDPKDFLSKYNHVEQLLADFGLTLFREPFTGPPTAVEEVGHLIAEYKAFVDERRPKDPKPYDALDHDIRVWLAVQNKRVPGRTAIDGGALFVTLDFLFHDFDRHYLRTYNKAPASVVLPHHLHQVLRPFGRQSADLDARFVETFGISEIRTAHSDYGDTTSKVLSLLATYADVPEETAVRILADEVLLAGAKSLEEDSEELRAIVDNALIRDNTNLLEEQEALRREREVREAEYERELLDKENEIANLRTEITEALERVDRDREEGERRAEARHDELQESLRQAAEGVGAQAEAREAEAKRADGAERRARLASAALVAVLGGVVIGVVPWATHWAWLQHHEHRVGLYLSAAAMCAVACWAILQPEEHRREKALAALGVIGSIILQIV